MTDQLGKVAFGATLHCLTGCALGEVSGVVIGTALGWGNVATLAAGILLAFVFGYSLTVRSLLRAGVAFGTATRLAFASDTLSIATMELVDTAVLVVWPAAMEATLLTPLFWGSLMISLFVAFWAAYPVNRYLLARGKGHALVHHHHVHH